MEKEGLHVMYIIDLEYNSDLNFSMSNIKHAISQDWMV